MFTRRSVLLAPMLTGALAPFSVSAADDFPSGPVTLVVSFPPGGSLDAVARAMADSPWFDPWAAAVISAPATRLTIAPRATAASAATSAPCFTRAPTPAKSPLKGNSRTNTIAGPEGNITIADCGLRIADWKIPRRLLSAER